MHRDFRAQLSLAMTGGATYAWNAALMRPDRFKAVFCSSVPYVPRGDVSVFDKMRKSAVAGGIGFSSKVSAISHRS